MNPSMAVQGSGKKPNPRLRCTNAVRTNEIKKAIKHVQTSESAKTRPTSIEIEALRKFASNRQLTYDDILLEYRQIEGVLASGYRTVTVAQILEVFELVELTKSSVKQVLNQFSHVAQHLAKGDYDVFVGDVLSVQQLAVERSESIRKTLKFYDQIYKVSLENPKVNSLNESIAVLRLFTSEQKKQKRNSRSRDFSLLYKLSEMFSISPGVKLSSHWDLPFSRERYLEVFRSNLGIVTEKQQEKIGQVRIAIAGVGGIGSAHLVNLLQMGFQKFVIADHDVFAPHNQKQVASTTLTEGRKKVQVLHEFAMAKNPHSEVMTFPEGINESNVRKFLENVDIVMDGMDIFNMKTRRLVFNTARKMGIPVITVGPFGLSAASMIFTPRGPSFDEYFDVNKNTSELKMQLHFLIGLAPKVMHLKYILPEYVSLEDQKVPSHSASTFLAAGIGGANVMSLLFHPDTVKSAPWGYQFDAYQPNFAVHEKLRGNRNLIQRIKIWRAKWKYRDLIRDLDDSNKQLNDTR